MRTTLNLIMLCAIFLSPGCLDADDASGIRAEGIEERPASIEDSAVPESLTVSDAQTADTVDPSRDNPRTVQLDQWTSDDISKTDDDWYSFQANGPQRDVIEVALENQSEGLKPRLLLYDADRRELHSTTQWAHELTSGQNIRLRFAAVPNGEYSLNVKSLEGEGSYRIRVHSQKAYDEYEPNEDVLNPSGMRTGETISGNIMDDLDEDFYVLESVDADSVTVWLENKSSTLKPQILLYNADRKLISQTSQWGHEVTAGQHMGLDSRGSSTIYAQVKGLSGTGGGYELTINGLLLRVRMDSAVLFDHNQSVLKPEATDTLRDLVERIRRLRNARVQVAGHTDSEGSDAYNLELSKKRAEAVRSFLVANNAAPPSNIEAIGYGEGRPIASNGTEDGRAQNRRVEVSVFPR